MSLFGLGKKKEEAKVELACACNGEVATYEASSCCCGGQQVETVVVETIRLQALRFLVLGVKAVMISMKMLKRPLKN